MRVWRSVRPTQSHERVEFVWLWASGVPVRDIAIRSHTSVTTVYRWIRRYQREGHVNTRPRSGRPPVPVSHSWKGKLSLPTYDVLPCAASTSSPAASNTPSNSSPSVYSEVYICRIPHCTHHQPLKSLTCDSERLTVLSSQATKTTRGSPCTQATSTLHF